MWEKSTILRKVGMAHVYELLTPFTVFKELLFIYTKNAYTAPHLTLFDWIKTNRILDIFLSLIFLIWILSQTFVFALWNEWIEFYVNSFVCHSWAKRKLKSNFLKMPFRLESFDLVTNQSVTFTHKIIHFFTEFNLHDRYI